MLENSSSQKQSQHTIYDPYLDRLILFFTSETYRDEVAASKKEFFDESGIVDEESPLYEMRVTQFLEWYLLTRKLSQVGLTPAEYCLQLGDFQMSSVERPAFESLACARHSLFEFQKIRGSDIHVRDLWLNKLIVVPESPVDIGFSRDEIFDARLIPDGESFRFGRSFCFHPAEASTFIHNEIKRIKKSESRRDEEMFMLRLLKMRYKYEHYRHLKLEYVYTNEKKVKF